MSAFAAAIFDLDGTLIDTERLVIDAGLRTLDDLGHPVTRDFMVSLVGVAEEEGFRRLCAHIGATLDQAAFDSAWSSATRAAYATGIPVMPGAGRLLAILSERGTPRAVATNSSTGGARRKLAEAGIARHFDMRHVIGFDAVARPKPSPDVFLAAAAALGVDPARCIAFEDSDTGTEAALAAGMTVVQIPDMLPAQTRNAHHLAASILDGARAAGLID